jgi:hypothetical protein
MAETCKHLGVSGSTIIRADTEPLTAAHLLISLSILQTPPIGEVCNLSNNNTMKRNTERELLKASGKTWTHQTQTDTKLLSATCLSCPIADPFSTKKMANLPGECNTLFEWHPHILAQLGSQLHALWTKLVAKYTEGIFLLCLGEKAECRAEKAFVGVGQLSSPCGESQALHCLGKPGAS